MHLRSAERLDLAMAAAHCTNSELARAAGYRSHAYISRMRRGTARSKAVRPDAARSIARHLDVPLLWLFVVPSSSNSTGIATKEVA